MRESHPWPRAALALVPILSVLVVALAWWATLHNTGSTPTTHILADVAYWLLALLLPGFLIHRSLRGPADTWIAELSIAGCVGLAAEMLAWMLLTLADANGALRWWPLLPILVVGVWGAADPNLRRRLVASPQQRVHPVAAMLFALSACVVIDYVRRTFIAAYRLPYSGGSIYQDLFWHMGLGAEAKRSFPLHTPQSSTAGDLVYHWYANAHIGAESLITGLGVPELVMRLYALPLCMLALGMTFTLAHWASKRQLAGAIAATLLATPWSTAWWKGLMTSSTAWNPLSPSHTFALPLIVFYCYCVAVVLRHATTQSTRVPRSAWVMLILAAYILVGAKASAPPTVFAATLLALAVTLFWRRGRIAALAVAAVTGVMFEICRQYVSGGSAGANMQIGAIFSMQPIYKSLHSGTYSPNAFLIPGLGGRPGVGVWLIAGILIFGLITTLPATLAAVALRRGLRRDITAWLLMGACGAALLPYLALQQGGYSEWYFLMGVLPFGVIAIGWATASLLDPVDLGSRRVRGALAVGAIALCGSVALTWHGTSWARHTHSNSQILAETKSMVILVIVVALLLAIGAVLLHTWSRRTGRRGIVALAASAAIVGATSAELVYQPVAGSTSTPPAATALSRAEADAGSWIASHLRQSALLATNYHCHALSNPPVETPGAQRTACNANVWWLSGLGQRRVLVESWSYVPASANRKPFFDLPLLQLNQDAYIKARPQDLAELRAKGVSYMVVVRGVTRIAPRLWTETDKVYDNGAIAVVRLR